MLNGVIKYSDGRTIYGCNTTAYAPTNPKSGSTTGGNTVVWNSYTRESTVISPRQAQSDDFVLIASPYSNKNPTTTQAAPYLSTYSNQSRVAPQTLQAPKQTVVSRYSTDTNWAPCESKPVTVCSQGVYPAVFSNACQFPSQTTTTYKLPFG